MNCFHFCIFELSKASVSKIGWLRISCELLSFLYLWTIKSITTSLIATEPFVVNCFHFCIFELSKASYIANSDIRNCCELLSFLYLWTIKSIALPFGKHSAHVVNCFHFCIFELSKASDLWRLGSLKQLWIAFIFVSLNYQKHLLIFSFDILYGCELLSFLYLWTIKSISYFISFLFISVVNCFHFCIFELSKASLVCSASKRWMLWIAFIFVSLNYQKHLILHIILVHLCCELLSFLYLWTIKSILSLLRK